MGFAGRMETRWRKANQSYMSHQQRISDVAGGIGGLSKVLRMMLQSAMLGLGAYLVIQQEATDHYRGVHSVGPCPGSS